jgi:thioredoxin-like negative regulator of GroEL
VGLVSCVLSHLRLPQLLGRSDAKSDRQFEQAQQEYLRGNWFEAEAILLDLLQRFPRDIQAGLLLVGVLRHTQRWQPALRRLDQLQLIDGAQGWHFEIQRERQLIEKRRSESLEQETEA